MNLRPPVVLVICGDSVFTERIVQEISLMNSAIQTPLATHIARALDLLEQYSPDAILVDQSAILAGTVPLDEILAPFTERAPVVFVGDASHQEILTVLIGSGAVDMVARVGNFAPVAAGLLERRIRFAELAETAGLDLAAGEPFGETLRHEVNNPLTGILGNAQLLLARARREGLHPRIIERLQTIAELAIRLRETVRVLSQTWEDSERNQLKSGVASEIRS